MDYFVNVLYDSNSRFEAQAGARLSEHSTYGISFDLPYQSLIKLCVEFFDLRFLCQSKHCFYCSFNFINYLIQTLEMKPYNLKPIKVLELGGSVLFKNDGQIQFAYFNRDHKNFVAHGFYNLSRTMRKILVFMA